MRAFPIRTILPDRRRGDRRGFLSCRPKRRSPRRTRAAKAAASPSGNWPMADAVGQGESRASRRRTSARSSSSTANITILVVSATFGIRDYAFTGAPNPQDITGGRRTPVWAEKTPDHRGYVLTSAVDVDIDGPDLVIKRSGTGDLDMKIQAKDCATGGIFQMEPERGDHTATVFTHILDARGTSTSTIRTSARGRAILVPYKDTMIAVPVAGQHRQRLLAQVRRPRQRAGRRADGRAQIAPISIPTRLRGPTIVAPLRWRVALGSGERRPHGLRDRRGRGRGGAAGDRMHPGVPGAEPGPRTLGRAGLPVPGAGQRRGSSRTLPLTQNAAERTAPPHCASELAPRAAWLTPF